LLGGYFVGLEHVDELGGGGEGDLLFERVGDFGELFGVLVGEGLDSDVQRGFYSVGLLQDLALCVGLEGSHDVCVKGF